MKKTALTIGLFSLVVVATSFANPDNDKLNTKGIVTPFAVDGTGGQKTGTDRRQDFTNTKTFASNSQFITPSRKID